MPLVAAQRQGRAQHIAAQALQPRAVVGRHPHVGVQVEALQVRLPRPARRHGFRFRLLAEPPHPHPRARAQRHPPLDRGPDDPGQQGEARFLTRALTEATCLTGGSERIVERLKELESQGLSQIMLYPPLNRQYRVVEDFTDRVIARL